MKKLRDSDWSRAVELLCNSVQKCVIPCKNLKANKSVKMQKFLYNDWGMNCPCTHELAQANKSVKIHIFLLQWQIHELAQAI